MKDWHITQNQEYLDLCQKRLGENKLIWVEQFSEILKQNSEIASINDIGCNVGHFYRAVKDYFPEVNYVGFDVSKIYLNIAKKSFGNFFEEIDISNQVPRIADATIISATLEHVENHRQALNNIISSSKKLIILRTFIGNEYLEEKCFKNNAEVPYTIKQFTSEELENIFKTNNWAVKYVEDSATSGEKKNVCENIFRTQKIIIAKKK